MFLLLTFLLTKHLIADFPLQFPYQWMNKGTYGHPGGLIHAFIHAWLTICCLLFCFSHDQLSLTTIWIIASCEFTIHYHIDWLKMNVNKYFGLVCDKHAWFWNLVGFDQYLHNLTYLGITYICFR